MNVPPTKRGWASFVARFIPPPAPGTQKALALAERRTQELEARLDALLLLADASVHPRVSLPTSEAETSNDPD